MQSTTMLAARIAALGLATFATACAAHPSKPAQDLSPSRSSTLRSLAERAPVLLGAAVDPAHLTDQAYAETLASQFDMLEPENQLKFALVHPRPDGDPQPYDFSGADQLAAFASAHRMKMRGHTLVWSSQLSPWLTARERSPAELSNILERHIATVVARYAGTIVAWDVVNEPFAADGSLRRTLWSSAPGIGLPGTAYIEQALRWAHQADPSASLYVNDFGIEEINAKSDALYAMARDFKARGVPLDGIGFQCHLTLSFDRPDALHALEKNLARFAALGLRVAITELDVRLRDAAPETLDAQAALYGKLVRLCLRQPACTAIQTWGVTDRYSWIPQFFQGWGFALLWDDDFNPKPALRAVRDALAAGRSAP